MELIISTKCFYEGFYELPKSGQKKLNKFLREFPKSIISSKEFDIQPIKAAAKGMKRLKLGDYRLFFHQDKNRVIIFDIRKKNDDTYKDAPSLNYANETMMYANTEWDLMDKIIKDFKDNQNARKQLFETYLKKANSGNGEYAYKVAFNYSSGILIDQDMKEAYHYFKEAARKGIKEAYYHLGGLYYHGYIFERDIQKAKEWYEKASYECNDSHSQYYLGKIALEKGKEDEAEYWFLEANENKNIKSQYKLAEIYQAQGKLKEAFEYYKKAAFSGNGNAQYKLADCYWQGLGTEKNELDAYFWYKQCLSHGDFPKANKKLNQYYNNEKRSKNKEFYFDVAGSRYFSPNILQSQLTEFDELNLKYNPENPWDENIIEVYTRNNERIGSVPKNLIKKVSRLLEENAKKRIFITSLLKVYPPEIKVKIELQED